jgi:hypothetical protein
MQCPYDCNMCLASPNTPQCEVRRKLAERNYKECDAEYADCGNCTKVCAVKKQTVDDTKY